MKLTKKILALILMFCIVLTLFVPVSTFAAVPTPVAQWNLDGSALDSVEGWDATVSGDSNITTGLSGQKGTAWKVTHNSAAEVGITLGKLPSNLVGKKQITLSAWIKRENLAQTTSWVDDWQTVFELHSGSKIICNAKFGNYDNYSNPFSPLLNDNDVTTDEHSLEGIRSDILDGAFHHIATVLDFSNTMDCKFYFYVDGVLWNSFGLIGERGAFEASWVGCENGFPEGTKLYLGSNNALKRQFNGLIDEVQVYDTALTGDEVVELYNSYLIDFNDSIVGLWDFNSDTLANSVEGVEWSDPVITSDEEINPITKNHVGKKEEAWRSSKIGIYGSEDKYKSGIDLGALPADLVGSKTMTISTWIKREDFADRASSPEDWQTVLQLYNEDANKIIFNARFGDNIAEFAPLIYDNDWLAVRKSDSHDYTISTDVFHHIATVLDFSDVDNCKVLFYIDGVLWYDSYAQNYETKTLTANLIGCENGFSAGTKLYVGSNKNLRRQFNGMIDEVRVYSSALSPNDITKLYNSYTPAQVTVADSESQMGSADAFGADNTIALNVTGGTADVSASYEADNTIDGVFKNNYLRVSGIPSGLYVSEIQTNENTATVRFGGKAVTPLIDDVTLNIVAYPSLTADAGANSEPVSVFIKHDTYDFAALAGAAMNGENKYTVTLRPGVYADEKVAVIVAVYDGQNQNRLKDVYLQNYDVTNENITVSTEVLSNYTEGDIVRLFVWHNTSSAEPVKLFNLN